VAGGRQFQFNERRFKDLLLYAAKQLEDDPTFGETKLNKILFFIDFEQYMLTGNPVTGAEYQKNKFGPTARMYPVMRDELLRTNQAKVERRLVGDHVQDVLIPLVQPNMQQFAEDEMKIIDLMVNDMRQYTNMEASEITHQNSPGWQAKQLGETIHYETALIDMNIPAAEEAIDFLRRLERISA
jgi:uncharacterized phage-associated protein